MDEKTYHCLTRLLAYCEAEEHDHYMESPSPIHIYNDIIRLRAWVNVSAKEYQTND